jgi:glutathione S-transferase
MRAAVPVIPDRPRQVTQPVTLFGHWICPYSVRVEFMLTHLGLHYETVEVPPTAARPKGFVVPEEFVANSPKGEIPMVRADGRYLSDSLPILEFLSPNETHEARHAARWVDASVFPAMIGVYYGVDSRKIDRAAEALGASLGALEARMDSSGWLVGRSPSMAEAALVPLYVRLEGLRALGFARDLPPGIRAHADRVLDLPGGSAVRWSAEQTEEFVWRFTTFRERSATP